MGPIDCPGRGWCKSLLRSKSSDDGRHVNPEIWPKDYAWCWPKSWKMIQLWPRDCSQLKSVVISLKGPCLLAYTSWNSPGRWNTFWWSFKDLTYPLIWMEHSTFYRPGKLSTVELHSHISQKEQISCPRVTAWYRKSKSHSCLQSPAVRPFPTVWLCWLVLSQHDTSWSHLVSIKCL